MAHSHAGKISSYYFCDKIKALFTKLFIKGKKYVETF